MVARGPKMDNSVFTGCYPSVFGCSRQLLPVKFCVPCTPFMRKVNNGGETGKKGGGK